MLLTVCSCWKGAGIYFEGPGVTEKLGKHPKTLNHIGHHQDYFEVVMVFAKGLVHQSTLGA